MTTDRRHALRAWQQARLIFQLTQDTLDERGGAASRVIEQDAWLSELWAAVEPEVRRDVLLFTAWLTRDVSWFGAESIEERYAAELAACAARWAAEHPGATWQTFCSAPHPSYSLASSLSFDRDDIGVTWSAAVLLTSKAEQ
jgi:hypothetical protein